MLTLLLDKGANINILNHDGENVMDIWVKRISYDWALIIKEKGIEAKSVEFYEPRWEIPFDIPLFLDYLAREKQVESSSIFFDKIRAEEAEYRK